MCEVTAGIRSGPKRGAAPIPLSRATVFPLCEPAEVWLVMYTPYTVAGPVQAQNMVAPTTNTSFTKANTI
eukprot:scaffold41215_cov57-Phaeocystis_antarctica.AAC.4